MLPGPSDFRSTPALSKFPRFPTLTPDGRRLLVATERSGRFARAGAHCTLIS
jgi:hypothetical protein